MTMEQFQEKYKLSLPLKTRKEFEAVRRRMGALTEVFVITDYDIVD